MSVCIAATAAQRLELQKKDIAEKIQIEWVAHTTELFQSSSNLLIDCTFTGSSLPLLHRPLLIHSPVHTLSDLNARGQVARFCAWSGFIQRNIWEIAILENTDTSWLQHAMQAAGLPFILIKDKPGLIAPRIICNIINEASLALKEGISTKEEIDLAMKLGTNYPYGPFEWAEKIGWENIRTTLESY